MPAAADLSRQVVTGLTARLSRTTAGQLALGRAAVGTSMLARPTLLPRALGVDSASAARMAWTTRMLGAREVALGLGAWTALRSGDSGGARIWLLAGVLSDGVDALALGAASARGDVRRVRGSAVALVAAGAVAVQVGALNPPRRA